MIYFILFLRISSDLFVLFPFHIIISVGQGGQSHPLEKLIEEIPGYGKTGQFLPTLMTQVQGLREVFSFAELVDNALDSLDNQAPWAPLWARFDDLWFQDVDVVRYDVR